MTIAPVGRFTGWFYSKELQVAKVLGYKIEILKGYHYSKEEILFKDYMDKLYNLRTQYPKTDVLNLIAKLLGNSFYGRFGMHPLFNSTKILDKDQFYKLMHTGNIDFLKEFVSCPPWDSDDIFITTNFLDTDKIIMDDLILKTDVSIGISACVAAYSRMIMSVFKNVPGVILYYTDTDSIVTNLSPQQMLEILKVNIGPDMGQLKLECVINRAVFLAPKAYFLELENGESIVKIKGLNQNNLSDIHKDKLNLTGFINLLQKDSSLKLDQEIWAKNREESTVNIFSDWTLKVSQI